MKLNHWLRQTLNIFELKVRAGRTKEGHDIYYCAGWAAGYKTAHKDARKASRADGVDVPALPRGVNEPAPDRGVDHE